MTDGKVLLFETISSSSSSQSQTHYSSNTTSTTTTSWINNMELLCHDLTSILSKHIDNNDASSDDDDIMNNDDNYQNEDNNDVMNDIDIHLNSLLENATSTNDINDIKASITSWNETMKMNNNNKFNEKTNQKNNVLKDNNNNLQTKACQIQFILKQIQTTIQQLIENRQPNSPNLNSLDSNRVSDTLSLCITSLLGCTSFTSYQKEENGDPSLLFAIIDSSIYDNLSNILSNNSIILNHNEFCNKLIIEEEPLSNVVMPIELLFHKDINDIKTSRLKRLYQYHQELMNDDNNIRDSCNNVWKSLYQLIVISSSSSSSSSNFMSSDEKFEEKLIIDNTTIPWMEQFFNYIIENDDNMDMIVSISSIVKALRLHFFGKDILPEKTVATINNNNIKKEYIHLGKVITKDRHSSNRYNDEHNSVIEKPYEKYPSRFHSMIIFLSYLQPSFMNNHLSTIQINDILLNNLLPICYELLASSDDATIGIGASCLYHLLRCSCFDVNLDETTNNSNIILSGTDKTKYGEKTLLPVHTGMNLIHVLYDVIKTCRIGLTLALLGNVQQYVFRILLVQQQQVHHHNNNIEDIKQKRRVATQQWLLILDQNRQTTDTSLLCGLLIGGIMPLLYDHGTDINSPMDALELGRPGLSALLPLIRCDRIGSDYTQDNDLKICTVCIQLATMNALCNFIIASYPIMSRHSGKILCELIAFLHYLNHSSSITTSSSNLLLSQLQQNLIITTEHVTSITIAICGVSATTVLETIQKGGYDDEMICLIDKLQKSSYGFSTNQ